LGFLVFVSAAGLLACARMQPPPATPTPKVQGDAEATALLSYATPPLYHRPIAHGERGPGVPDYWVRPGHKVTVAIENIPQARFIAVDHQGIVYVSRPDRGDILTYKESQGTYQPLGTFLDHRPKVQAMQVVGDWLWFATSRGVFKTRVTPSGKAGEIVDVLPEGSLPGESGHWWRSLYVAPHCIYTSVGDTGNIEDLLQTTEREKIWKFSLDGKQKELWCSGIRNCEQLAYRPGTTELWGGDQGSDWYGQPLGDKKGHQPVTDYNPPEEFNHYTKNGFYGHPFVEGFRTPRLEYYGRKDLLELAQRTTVPEWGFPAHAAFDGYMFLDDTGQFPKEFHGDAIVCLHGSWNHSHKSGYRVEHLLFDPVSGKPYGSLPLVVTVTDDEQVLARPVACAMAPDGSILVSCDNPGNVFKISYVGPNP
jgi:glucose/arabinose dehydrogenase